MNLPRARARSRLSRSAERQATFEKPFPNTWVASVCRDDKIPFGGVAFPGGAGRRRFFDTYATRRIRFA
eukprot:7289415-Pyramimonas_sp.AAC.1